MRIISKKNISYVWKCKCSMTEMSLKLAFLPSTKCNALFINFWQLVDYVTFCRTRIETQIFSCQMDRADWIFYFRYLFIYPFLRVRYLRPQLCIPYGRCRVYHDYFYVLNTFLNWNNIISVRFATLLIYRNFNLYIILLIHSISNWLKNNKR